MNKKTKTSPKQAGGACLCYGLGPGLSELLRHLGPPEAARRHFDAARVEFLKGLRALLDARIEQVSKRAAKGEKIEVE
jgi:hypothetical protein